MSVKLVVACLIVVNGLQTVFAADSNIPADKSAPKPVGKQIKKSEPAKSKADSNSVKTRKTETEKTEPKEWTSKSIPGDGSVFTFRGGHIGELKSKKDADFGTGIDRVTGCIKFVNNGMEAWQDRTVEYPMSPGSSVKGAKIGDIAIKELFWYYLDDKLVGFKLTGYVAYFNDLKNVMIARYGEPSRIENNVVQNMYGKSFEQISLIWDTPDGPMALTCPDGQATQLTIIMMQKELNEELDKRSRKEAEKKAKSTF